MASTIVKKVFQIAPRYYADICSSKPPEYYDYMNYTFSFGNTDDYDLFNKIGKGRYSEVYSGYNIVSRTKCILKILKENQDKKLKREIKILETIKNGPNVPILLDILQERGSQTRVLVFDAFSSLELSKIYMEFELEDIRKCMFQLLNTLDFAHSCGIMHRDVKPNNIVIDPLTKQIKLIDWGLAEFYIPDNAYNVRVSTRAYKGPELLLNFQFYDYSLDIWCLGVLFASMMFKKQYFFDGEDSASQLNKMVRILGSDDLEEYIKKFHLNFDYKLFDQIGRYNKKSWDKFITGENKISCSAEAIDLLDLMLKFDHSKRIAPLEALKHPFFSQYYQSKQQN